MLINLVLDLPFLLTYRYVIDLKKFFVSIRNLLKSANTAISLIKRIISVISFFHLERQLITYLVSKHSLSRIFCNQIQPLQRSLNIFSPYVLSDFLILKVIIITFVALLLHSQLPQSSGSVSIPLPPPQLSRVRIPLKHDIFSKATNHTSSKIGIKA